MLPNLILAGAAKSGTTFLAQALAQHPDIFMTPYKECAYFAFENPPNFRGPGDDWTNRHVITHPERYEKLFAGAGGRRIVGEASVYYLAQPASFGRMREVLGSNVKIIVILRSPADRAFSAFAHHVRDGREHLGFPAALDAEQTRLAAGWEYSWGYRGLGHYAAPLAVALDVFGRDQVKVCLYDDLQTDPRGLLGQLCKFLGVRDETFRPDVSKRTNPSGTARSKAVQKFVVGNHVLKKVWRPFVPAGVRYDIYQKILRMNVREINSEETDLADLMGEFEEEVLAVSELTGLDLKRWSSRAP